SVDYSYTSHFLENLEKDEGLRLIREIFRVLKPHGVVRIVVPDLAIGTHKYLKAIESNPRDAEAGPEFLNWLQLRRPGVRDPHLWMYDAPSLTAMLTRAGFANVAVCEFGKGRVPDCDILDSRPEDSLHVEAEKP
ncbi:MAG: methyltransferase domain-containing protein, partial [Pyrinomonadaceae bacterium]